MFCKPCTQVCVHRKRKFHGGFTCVSVRHWQKLAYLRQQLQAISAHWPSYYIFNCLPPISLYTCTALAKPPHLLNECDLFEENHISSCWCEISFEVLSLFHAWNIKFYWFQQSVKYSENSSLELNRSSGNKKCCLGSSSSWKWAVHHLQKLPPMNCSSCRVANNLGHFWAIWVILKSSGAAPHLLKSSPPPSRP